jgi:metal-responsive CopG/Arc/MetJ family transcriptional regulator
LAQEYNHGYTHHVKTAISIPDSVFEAAERLAARRKMSRSELYSLAVADWVERHRDDRVTEALDALYGADSSGSDTSTSVLDADLQGLQVHSLRRQRR